MYAQQNNADTDAILVLYNYRLLQGDRVSMLVDDRRTGGTVLLVELILMLVSFLRVALTE
jgi:hypothetical protein